MIATIDTPMNVDEETLIKKGESIVSKSSAELSTITGEPRVSKVVPRAALTRDAPQPRTRRPPAAVCARLRASL